MNLLLVEAGCMATWHGLQFSTAYSVYTPVAQENEYNSSNILLGVIRCCCKKTYVRRVRKGSSSLRHNGRDYAIGSVRLSSVFVCVCVCVCAQTKLHTDSEDIFSICGTGTK